MSCFADPAVNGGHALRQHHRADCVDGANCPVHNLVAVRRNRALTCDNKARPTGATNTHRPLTHSLDYGEEGMAVKATRTTTCRVDGCTNPRHGKHTICSMHAYRWRKFQSFDLPEKPPKPVCAVDGCDRTARGRQAYCAMHVERIRNHGDPGIVLVDRHDPEGRFWAKVEKTDTCWLWRGVTTYDGYGLHKAGNKRTGAHRFAYEYVIGPIPEGLHLDHLCRVRNCVRPDHLEPVTPAENNRRALAARVAED